MGAKISWRYSYKSHVKLFKLYLSENFKTLLLLQIKAKSFQTCPEFSSQWSSQNIYDFWNFEFSIFNDFFLQNFKFTIAAYGRNKKNLNCLEKELS